MKPAAIGIQMHSGWGVLVAVSVGADSVEIPNWVEIPNAIEILERRRIITADPNDPGGNQPYHYASHLELPESDKYLANCAAATTRLAAAAIAQVVTELQVRHCRTEGCAILLASGRPLPPLAKILTAHPLIHTAEGEFFRNTVRRACEELHIPVTSIRARELDERARTAFGTAAIRVQQTITNLGRSIGPPWTKDHKNATLAATLILSCKTANRS